MKVVDKDLMAMKVDEFNVELEARDEVKRPARCKSCGPMCARRDVRDTVRSVCGHRM